MIDAVLVDNDVLIKVSSWAIADDAFAVLAAHGTPALLAVTRFIVDKQMRRSSRISDKRKAVAQLKTLLERLETIEPTEYEIGLAAEFEVWAIKKGMPLDGGEAQLLAVLLCRPAALMVTGDKRAVGVIELLSSEPICEADCSGRIACLEQVIGAILVSRGAAYLHALICREPRADTGFSMIFSCTSGAPVDAAAVNVGLRSYVANLRASAPRSLFPENYLLIVP